MTTVCGQDDDILYIQLSLSSSGGERVRGNTQFPAVEAHTEHQVLVRGDGGPTVPPPPDPGDLAGRDLAGKYGVQAPAKDFEATLLGPNPTPGDSTLGMLSQDRSPRSESYARCTGHSWTGCRLNDRYPVQGPSTRSIPGESDQVMLSKDRSPWSESICLVERSSFATSVKRPFSYERIGSAVIGQPTRRL